MRVSVFGSGLVEDEIVDFVGMRLSVQENLI